MNGEPFGSQTFKENVQEAWRDVNALRINVFRSKMEPRQECFYAGSEGAVVIERFFMAGDPEQVTVWAALGLIPAWNELDDF